MRIRWLGVAIGVAALALPGVASAAPPQLLSAGHVLGHPSATWLLPPGVETAVIEVATDPATGTDGYFFTENTVAFDIPEPSTTYWLSSSPLPPGAYFVHVAGYEPSCAYDTCPGRQWSQILPLLIGNERPRIVSRRFRLSWYPSLGSAFVTLRLRVCDDSPGELAILIVQRRRVDGRLVAIGRSVRRQLAPDRSCRQYELLGSVRRKFFGAGAYSVTVRVRDNGGRTSAAVRTAWPAPG